MKRIFKKTSVLMLATCLSFAPVQQCVMADDDSVTSVSTINSEVASTLTMTDTTDTLSATTNDTLTTKTEDIVSTTSSITTTGEENEVTTQQEEGKLSENAVLYMVTGYEFPDGSFDPWFTGIGLACGNGLAVVPVSVVGDVTSTEFQKVFDEKNKGYERVGINLKNAQTAKAGLVTYAFLNDGKSEKLEVVQENGTSGVVIMRGSILPMQITALAESEDVTNVQAVFVESSELDNLARTVGSASVNIPLTSTTKALYDAKTQTAVMEGSATTGNAILTDNTGDVVAIATRNDGGVLSCTGSGILRTLLGIQQDPTPTTTVDISPTITPIDDVTDEELDALDATIKEAKAIDTTMYTTESVEKYNTVLKEAEDILRSPSPTKSNVEDAVQKVKDAKNLLVEAESTIPTWLPIACLGVSVVIGAIIILLVLKKMKKRNGTQKPSKKEKEKKQKTKDKDKGNTDIDENDENSDEIEEKDKQKENKKENKKEKRSSLFPWKNKNKPVKPDTKDKDKDEDNEYDDKYDDEYEDGEEEEEETGLLKKKKDEEDDATVLGAGDIVNAYLITDKGKRIPITRKQFNIGRARRKGKTPIHYVITATENDERVQDAVMRVSRLHCEIDLNGAGGVIKDLGSKNGTYLNGVLLEKGVPRPLHDGDEISVADYWLFVYHEGDEDE